MAPANDGYFVHLTAAPAATHRPTDAPAPPGQPPYEYHEEPSRKRRRRHRRVRVMPFVLLAIAAGLGWLQLQPGGVSGHINDWIDKVKGDVATGANPDLKQAADYFDNLYQHDSGYPHLTDDQIREDPNATFGTGVTIVWCTNRDMVLQGFNGSTSVSRLLLDGKVVGDATGTVNCPNDLSDPAPWKL